LAPMGNGRTLQGIRPGIISGITSGRRSIIATYCSFLNGEDCG
jgi:hypothetical protein